MDHKIRFVAMYLRKSRGDEDTELDKHRNTLTDICIENGWKFVEYSEIGTGDSISARPQMQKLLRDVSNETYDGVLVVDYDRLGRGDKIDQATIEDTFRSTKTLIITPSKIYDLNNESDMMLADFQGMIARQEYNMIKKRLQRGKKAGALMGNWTNGFPPIPYIYNKNTKKLEVDKDKLELYRFIVDSYLEGETLEEICWELNKMGVRSLTGGLWKPSVISNILHSEVHLGRIVYNKTRTEIRDGKKYKVRNSRDQWTIADNCHPAVKTKEEHELILGISAKRRLIPVAARARKKALSGLVKCAKCGYTLQIYSRSDRKGQDFVRTCSKTDPFGNRCPNKGAKVDIMYSAINEALSQYEKELIDAINTNEGKEAEYFREQINEKLEELKNKETQIERVLEGFELGVYTAEQAKSRKELLEEDINGIEAELMSLRSRLKVTESMTNEERLKAIEYFRNGIDKAGITEEDKNRLYKSIIDTIYWERLGDDLPTITVNFL